MHTVLVGYLVGGGAPSRGAGQQKRGVGRTG